MMKLRKPVRTTILYGIVCGLTFIPSVLLLDTVLPRALAIQFTVLLDLLFYGLILCRWGGRSALEVLFPLSLLAVFGLFGSSHPVFLALALIVFAWMRSGINATGAFNVWRPVSINH